MDLQLSGRVAIVTGASKGIGLAITRTLRQEGMCVVAASRKPSADVDTLGPDVIHVAVDLMDPEGPARVVERAVSEFGGLDVVVNNAGGPPPGVTLPRFGFLTPTDDDWRQMLEFNLLSVVRTIRAALPHLLTGGGGSIINVSSTLAQQPGAMNYDYSAAKAAVNTLTKGLSEEYGPRGIRVNTVSPGAVRTAWWTDEGGAADVLAEALGSDRDRVMDTLAPEMMRLVTGRLIDPQEIADAVALLASPRSGSTTGADFCIDGGSLKEL